MTITEILVSAGRTFSHPYESYSNLRPSVTLKAALGPEDDPSNCVRDLQAKAEALVEDHKQNTLKLLAQIDEMQTSERELADLEARIRQAQDRVAQLRSRRKELGVPEATQE